MFHLPGRPHLEFDDIRPTNASTVILLHELGHDRGMWAAVLPYLSPNTRVIVPDLRGHGHSAEPHGAWTMRDIVYDVADTLFSIGLRDTVIVGIGVGGIIAQALAAEVPQAVRAMMLIGTAAKLETEDRWLNRAQTLPALPPEARAQTLLKNATRSAPSPALSKRLQTTSPETLRRMCEAVAHTDLRASTDALRLPTLGLAGRDDRITPPDLMRELIEGIPGATLELLPQCGHLTPYDAPALTAQAINTFLAQTGHLLPDLDGKTPAI